MNQQEAQDFLFTEARLLDEGRLDEWLALTTDDLVYWIPVNDEHSDPTEHLSIIYDDRERCAERVFRISESGLNHPQDPPSRTTRFISNVQVENGAADEATLYCNTLLYEYRSGAERRDTIQPNLYAIRCNYRLRREQGVWKIAYRKLSFTNLDGPINAMTFFV